MHSLLFALANTASNAESIEVLRNSLWTATLETLAMTFSSALLTVLLGIPVGLLLVATAAGGIRPLPLVHWVVSFIVNIARSIPFIILIIALIPVTREIMGSALGWKGAVLSLTVASIPFYARLVESNILAIDGGKIEAAHMMGASRWQIMWGVQIREALPMIIQSTTVLIITLIGFSTMAGTVGNDGLGALVYNNGYVQHQNLVTLVVIVVVVVIVQIVQMLGDMISRWVDHR